MICRSRETQEICCDWRQLATSLQWELGGGAGCGGRSNGEISWQESPSVRADPHADCELEVISIASVIIMVQVDMIYRDSSIGNLIHISAVKLIVLKENESFAPTRSQSTVSASDMLKSFCKWQTHLNRYSATGPQYYDVALLLTR